MSIHLMTRAWNADLPTAQKFVLLSLADQANDDGVCWPRIDLISFRCAMHRRTVQRSLSDLEDAGYIQRHERLNQSTWYRIGITADFQGEFPVAGGGTAPPHEGRQSATPGGGVAPPGGRHSATHNHHRTSTEPSSPHKPPKGGRLARSKPGQEVYAEAFLVLWSAYPRDKAGSKFQAGKAWERLAPDEVLASAIVDDVKARIARHRPWREGIIPHASTYLNQRRWTEDIDTTEPRNVLDNADRRDSEAEDHLEELAHRYAGLA